MKTLRLILTALFFASLPAAAEALTGTWSTGEDNTNVETYQKDGKWYGKIVSSDNPKAKIGTNILIGFQQVDGIWKGKIYAPKRDKTVDATIKPSKDQLVISVSAGIIKKTLNWKKVPTKP